MSRTMHQTLVRLRKAAAFRQEGRDRTAVVDHSDLAALLEDYDRIDAQLRRGLSHNHNRVHELEEALAEVKDAIVRADPEVLTDTLWMPEDVLMGATVVDRIDIALNTDLEKKEN